MDTGGNATLHYYNGKFTTLTDCVVLLPTMQYGANTYIISCCVIWHCFRQDLRVQDLTYKHYFNALRILGTLFIKNYCFWVHLTLSLIFKSLSYLFHRIVNWGLYFLVFFLTKVRRLSGRQFGLELLSRVRIFRLLNIRNFR